MACRVSRLAQGGAGTPGDVQGERPHDHEHVLLHAVAITITEVPYPLPASPNAAAELPCRACAPTFSISLVAGQNHDGRCCAFTWVMPVGESAARDLELFGFGHRHRANAG